MVWQAVETKVSVMALLVVVGRMQYSEERMGMSLSVVESSVLDWLKAMMVKDCGGASVVPGRRLISIWPASDSSIYVSCEFLL